MRILLFCPRIPYPPYDGGAIAMWNSAKALHRCGHDIHILALNTSKHYVQEKQFKEPIGEIATMHTADIDTRVKVWPAFVNLFSSGSYNITRFQSRATEEVLQRVLQTYNFDAIQLESLYLTPYLPVIRKFSSAIVVLRAHNVEFRIWERMAQQSSGLKKIYLRLLAGRLKKYETDHLNEYNGIAAITAGDAETFKALGCKLPVAIVPAGIDVNEYVPQYILHEKSLVHLGSMDWMPNEEGVQWFLKNVWLHVRAAIPGATLYLAGRRMPQWIKESDIPGIVVHEDVPDAKDYIRSKALMIVPLLSGGGMRVKIVEGMALGKAIVSTTVGAEGVECTHEKNILLADTPEAFYRMIVRCMQDPSLVNTLGQNARRLVEEKYDNAKTGNTLDLFYKTLCAA